MIQFQVGNVIWTSWLIMSTALNSFLSFVFGVHLIRAIIACLELVDSATYENGDKSLAGETIAPEDKSRSVTDPKN